MLIIKVILLVFSATWVSCTIAGLSYMDPMNTKFFKRPPPDDPCNPLYWYPRDIPEYCYFRRNPKVEPKPDPEPVPLPIPVPAGPMPIPPVYPMPPVPVSPIYPIASVPLPIPPLPVPIYSQPMPLPFGIPLAPSNPFLPVAGVSAFSYPNPYPYYTSHQQIGMVPGIPGLVTDDGGINVLPFSDAYADLLDKHRRKMKGKKKDRDDDRRRHRY